MESAFQEKGWLNIVIWVNEMMAQLNVLASMGGLPARHK